MAIVTKSVHQGAYTKSFVAFLACSVIVGTVGCSAGEGGQKLDSLEAASSVPTSLEPFICSYGDGSFKSLETAASFTSSQANDAWNYLNDESLRGCWAQACTIIGASGDFSQFADLKKYVEDPQHKTTGDRLSSYVNCTHAIGAIAGRYSESSSHDTKPLVEHLIACSEESYWDQHSNFLKDFSLPSDVIKTKQLLSRICIEGLGLTRHNDASLKLSSIFNDTTETQKRRQAAEIGMERASDIEDNMSLLSQYLVGN